jgi:hypothetical protein
MGVIFVLILIIFLNAGLWIFFLKKFNSFFSTEKIIDETKSSIKNLIREMNFNVAKNIEVVDARINEAKSVVAEAERRIGTLKKELAATEKIEKFQKQISAAYEPPVLHKISAEQNETQKNLTARNSAEEKSKNSAQEIPEENSTEKIQQTEIPQIVKNSGEKSEKIVENAEISAKIPAFSVSKTQIEIKKDFKDSVKELLALGLPPDEIARQTGRSVQEVKVVMELF